MKTVCTIQRLLIACLICFPMVLAGTMADAAGQAAEYCGNKPVKVGYFKLGYRFYVENGKEKGMNVDILEELRKRTGCTFVSQEMSFARIWTELASGDLDMSLSGIWSPERDKTLWCAPSITSKNYAVLGSKARASVHSEGDFLKNGTLQFGVVRGYTHGKELDLWLKKMREAGRVEESANVDILFEKLKQGRIDGIFAFPFVYRKLLKELQMKDAAEVQDWFPEEKGIIGCTMLTKSRFSEAEANRWRALIRQMQSDGTLKKIFTRYVSPAEADQMLKF